MSEKIFGDVVIWAGASELGGGYFPVIGVRRGDNQSLHAVIRDQSYITLELAHDAAKDAVAKITSIDDANVLKFSDGSSLQAA